MKVAFHTLGCKVNQYETEGMAEAFLSRGFTAAGQGEAPDVFVLNSCTVTATGDQKTRQLLRSFGRRYPEAVLVLTGCFPQAYPALADALPEAQVIIGTSGRRALPDLVLRYLSERRRIVEIAPTPDALEPLAVKNFAGQTRGFLKIQDGCDNRCSYCIIPTARGRSRSKPTADVMREVDELVSAGFREVVFVGINLLFYAAGEGSIVDLLEAVSARHPALRLRLGSCEPERIAEGDLRRLGALPGFCPQFHLSLQSGCDSVLRRMGRRYDTAFYRGLAGAIRRQFPHATLTTDIIVGFPGETEEEFQETVRFVREIGFLKVHVFPYSLRPGTRAAGMDAQIDGAEKARRAKALAAAADERTAAVLESQIGRAFAVLIERREAGGWSSGHTETYIPAVFPGGTGPGEVVPVIAREVRDGALRCEVLT